MAEQETGENPKPKVEAKPARYAVYRLWVPDGSGKDGDQRGALALDNQLVSADAEVLVKVAEVMALNSGEADRKYRAIVEARWREGDMKAPLDIEYRCVAVSSADPIYGAQAETRVSGKQRRT